LDETPKVGKNDGSQLLAAVVVAAGSLDSVGVVWSSVPEGLALTGRSGWSVGLVMMFVLDGAGAIGVGAPWMVVVEMISA